VNDDSSEPKIFRVLSLDDGVAKGFYTLGALKETEALVACRLCEKVDLIYGTSTGYHRRAARAREVRGRN
jgi:uncharacterized protein